MRIFVLAGSYQAARDYIRVHTTFSFNDRRMTVLTPDNVDAMRGLQIHSDDMVIDTNTLHLHPSTTKQLQFLDGWETLQRSSELRDN